MPSGFFCLLRFYLRVDDTLIRVIDNRFHFEVDKDYIVREYTYRESKFSDLQVRIGWLSNEFHLILTLPLIF